jgi:hypothetical protein
VLRSYRDKVVGVFVHDFRAPLQGLQTPTG